jgi:hypothetical protein
MKILQNFSVFRILFLIAISVFFQFASAQTSDKIEAGKIIALISNTYDRPDQKVITSPVVITENYAIAGWTKGDIGGRALLKKENGAWEIMACGGAGLKVIQNLVDAGIARWTASKLVSTLIQAERLSDQRRVKKFDLFDYPHSDGNITPMSSHSSSSIFKH